MVLLLDDFDHEKHLDHKDENKYDNEIEREHEILQVRR